MNYLGQQHWAVADLVTMGGSAPAIGLMMHLTEGFEFPWRAGGVALVRRELYPMPGEWQYCGLAIGEDEQISNYPGMAHTLGQGYQYAAVQFLGNGMISAMSRPVRVDFDDEGALIEPALGNWPISLTAKAAAGGTFQVNWEYDPWGQGGPPVAFQVFEGDDAGSVDYDSPLTDSETGLAYVAYSGSRRLYGFRTGVFAHGTEHVFGVRARNVDGIAEKNVLVSAGVRARITAPTAAPEPLRIHVEPRSRLSG